jgi:hypothetical protein
VFAVSQLKRGRRLKATEKNALRAARVLLTFIASPEVRHSGRESVSALTGSIGALEALRVVESQKPPSKVRNFLDETVAVIDRALANEDVSDEAATLESLQRLFAALVDVSLARANSLATASEDRLLWRRETTISVSS